MNVFALYDNFPSLMLCNVSSCRIKNTNLINYNLRVNSFVLMDSSLEHIFIEYITSMFMKFTLILIYTTYRIIKKIHICVIKIL